MPAPDKIRVAFSVTNCICYDQRVLKIAEAARQLNCDITIIGRKLGDCCNKDSVPFRTKRFRMIFKRGFLFYKFFNIRLFFHLLFHKYDLFVANDLDTLLPNYLMSKLKRIPMVYDSHEYFTEVPELNDRSFVKWVWKTIEKAIFPHLKYVITVSEPIASMYEKMYMVKPVVVRNCSRNADHITSYSRDNLNVSQGDLLVIIQGTGINIDKGAEELIDAVNILDGVALLVVGSGDVVPQLVQQVKELKIGHKVKFIPAGSWETLMKYTKTADMGMCLEKDTNLNYRYSLPNKLFNYISAGIPVISSDLQEIKKIIEQYNFGIVIPSVTPEEISKAILKLKNDPELLNKLKQNAVTASEKLNWENESKRVTAFYGNVINDVLNKYK